MTTRTKEAVKTGLAMAIAYAIALQMGWDRPYWAAFAVAFISLPTAGQSLHKGALRMFGTLVAGAAALTLIALFPQQRWWFMIFLSGYIGFCTYLMTGKKNQYFYQVMAFVCAIICFDGGANSLNAFQTAMVRIQQTGMGILVYTLVSVFLWPRTTGGELIDASRQLVAVQRGLFETCRGLMMVKGSGVDSRSQRMQEMQLIYGLEQTLDGAEVDSYEVWAARHQWRRFLQESKMLMEILGRWRESLPEIEQLDLNKLLPNLAAMCSELEMRFGQIQGMLTGEAPAQALQPMALAIDKAELAARSHFERAALAVTKNQLDRLEALSRSLFDCVQDIKGFSRQASKPPRYKVPSGGLALDMDRIAAVVRVLSGLWLAFLIWVYIDPPGHTSFVVIAVSLGLAFARFPQLPVSKTLLPALLSCGFAGVVYVFVMPHLSGYLQLGLMIFAVTFGITYLFHTPQQGLSRAFGLASFAVLTSISNQQTYNFAAFANSTAMIVLGLSLLLVTSYIPLRPQPEKAFLRLLRRFFRQAEFLMSHMALDRKPQIGWIGRWKVMLYQNDILELPQKLAVWGGQIDQRLFPGNTPEQVQILVNSLHALALRIKDLLNARENPQSTLLVRELIDDARTWRRAIETLFQRWSDNPATEPDTDLQEKLALKLKAMETRIDQTLTLAEQEELRPEDYENFYQLTGSYRGLSESVIVHAQLAKGLDWAQWKEERF
ncbi:MAG: FUSC family protein [Desulfobacteraceae bacterium]|nr:FUSC family protein [Desulfobacteraceae bacterium]